MKNISIIIPTFNRKNKIYNLLLSLCYVNYDFSKFEVIIVENNKKDGTENICKLNWPFDIKYHFIKNGIQAHSRNKGVELSNSNYLLFLDSDITVSKNIISEHLKMLTEYSSSIIIGNIKFPKNKFIYPQAKLYDVARYFKNFKKYYKNNKFSFIQCISCNLSIRKSDFYLIDGFNEKFCFYGYEDLEFGYRAEKNKLKLHFSEHALAYHYHIRAIDELSEKMSNMGISAIILQKIHPEIENKLKLGIFDAINNDKIKKSLKKININNIKKNIIIYEKKYIDLCYKRSKNITAIINKKKLFYKIAKLYKKFCFFYKFSSILKELEKTKKEKFVQLTLF